MMRLHFTPDQIEQLRYERYHHPSPRVQRRMEALLLKNHGIDHGSIAQIVGVSPNTLRAFFRIFRQGGIEALKQLDYHRPVSQLQAYQKPIEQDFIDKPPATVREAAARIEQLTGIRRSLTQVRVFLRRMGFKRRKSGLEPAGVNPRVQAEFLEKNSNRD
jgi:transposase